MILIPPPSPRWQSPPPPPQMSNPGSTTGKEARGTIIIACLILMAVWDWGRKMQLAGDPYDNRPMQGHSVKFSSRPALGWKRYRSDWHLLH